MIDHNVEFRKAVITDKEFITKYKLDTIIRGNNIAKEEYDQILIYLNNNIKEHLDDYQIILMENKIIGMFCYYKMEDEYLLDEIYLLHHYRNLGIGSFIIKQLQQELVNKKIYLWVYKTNTTAIKLYKSLGFKVIDETETRYKMMW